MPSGIDLLNNLTRLVPQSGTIFGTVLVTGTTPTLSQLSGFSESDQTQVSVTRSSSGVFVIVVTNFAGYNSYLAGMATSTTTSISVACTAQTYTTNTNTANFTFSCEDDASSQSDTGFNFILLAF